MGDNTRDTTLDLKTKLDNVHVTYEGVGWWWQYLLFLYKLTDSCCQQILLLWFWDICPSDCDRMQCDISL